MKKIFLFILCFSFFAVSVFSSDIKIPKNEDILFDELLDKLVYVDDELEFVYELSCNVKNDFSVFRFSKKSLLNKIEAVISIYFDSEKELDSFIDYVFINSDFRMKDIPSLFIEYKNNVIDSGGEVCHIEGETSSIKKILYNTHITMKK